MSGKFEIRGRKIGPGEPVFIIAEAGSNHDRELDKAHSLIEAAAEARVDAVKFQTFEARRLYPRSAGTSDYLGDPTPIYSIIEAMELPQDWLPELRDHAHRAGLCFISTPFHEEAVALIDRFVDAYKIASYELTHDPLLGEVGRRQRPTLLSTGASKLSEIRHAVGVLRENGCNDLAVLQCTASYPAPPESANVRALVTLRDALGVPTGLSDHTRDPTAAPMAAAALGAAVIEKHFTLSNDLPGPDHGYAVEPDELKRLVRGVRRVEAVLGSGAKDVHEVEDELRGFARRSLFTTRPVAAGERFSRDNVDILRRGKLAPGLAPAELERVLASTAARDLEAEQPIGESDLAREGSR